MGWLRTTVVGLRDRRAGRRLRSQPWVVNDLGVQLHVRPDDLRAQRMARVGGPLDRTAVAAARRLAGHLRPDLVIDVGANYGEVSLSLPPAEGRRVVLVEPNPAVARCLERSAAQVSGAEVVEAAASDSDGRAVLHLHGTSSGRSSLDASTARPGAVTVRTVRVDDLDLPPFRRLLFKVDTEGTEAAVLRGMSATIARAESWIGLVEINDPDVAASVPHAYRVRVRDLALVPVSTGDAQHRGDDALTKDLVLSSHPLDDLAAR